MFKWKKLGKVFDPTTIKDKLWLKEFAQAPAVAEYDDFIRVYFSCRPISDAKGQYVSYTSYIDLNKENLFDIVKIADTPVMELGKLGTFDQFGTYPMSVLKENSRCIAYYGGWTRCESVPFNVGIGIATSDDNGNSFKRIGDGPILSYSSDEPFVLSGPKIRRFNNQYYLFYIAGKKWVLDNNKPEPVYKIRLAISNDGFNWQKVNKDLLQSKVEADEAQASPDVIFYEGKYHMFFCYRHSKNYRNQQNGYRIGYAWSNDLISWTRADDKVGIDVSNEGWDSEMISYPHVFFLNKKLYMFYLGNQVGRYGFGLAELESYQP